MRKLLFVIAGIVLMASCSKDDSDAGSAAGSETKIMLNTKNDLSKLNLRGAVKQVREYSINFDQSSKLESKTIDYEKKFNDGGNLIQEKSFTDGLVSSYILYKYSEGLLKDVSSNKENTIVKYDYDSANKCLGYDIYVGPAEYPSIKYKLEFDTNGLLISKSKYNRISEELKLLYATDSNYVIETRERYTYSTVEEMICYKYSMDRVDGDLIGSDKSYLLKELKYSKTESVYNTNHQQISYSYHLNSSTVKDVDQWNLSKRYTQDYTSDGFLSTRINLFTDGAEADVYTYTYELDDHSNWIKRTSFVNGLELKGYIVREFVY